jgi:hypothetical protein
MITAEGPYYHLDVRVAQKFSICIDTGTPPRRMAEGPAGPDFRAARTAFVNRDGPQAGMG